MFWKLLKNKLKKITFLYYKYALIRSKVSLYRRNKEFKKDGMKLFETASKLMQNEELDVFCAFGTLLGIIREHGFIKNDCDLDFGIIENEKFSWDKVETAMKVLGLSKIKQFTFKGKLTEQTYYLNNPATTIDIFLYMRDYDEMWANIYHRESGKIYSSSKEYSVMHSFCPIINKFITTEIYNIPVKIPSNYEDYLRMVYGENWRIPDPSFSHKEKEQILEGEIGYCQYFWKGRS